MTRDAVGNFTLYSKLSTETDWVTEGTTLNSVVKKSSYFGLMYVNTSTTGSYYYFDDILVTGTKAPDHEAPLWTSFTLQPTNQLNLGFSEAMDFSKAAFSVNQGVGSPVSKLIFADSKSIALTFGSDFERAKLYYLQVIQYK